MISTATKTLQGNNKTIYVALLSTLTFFLFLDYIPGLEAWSAWVTPPVALFLGLIFALTCGQAHPKFNKKTSKYLLQYSVVGLGFGMNLHSALASGKEGMEFTVISVIGTLVIGWFIGRKLFKIDRNTAYLISSGTAICGGSAIAAVGPVLRAKDSEMSVALGTIFILNAIAVFIPDDWSCFEYGSATVRNLGGNCYSRYKFGCWCRRCLWRGSLESSYYYQTDSRSLDNSYGFCHFIYL